MSKIQLSFHYFRCRNVVQGPILVRANPPSLLDLMLLPNIIQHGLSPNISLGHHPQYNNLLSFIQSLDAMVSEFVYRVVIWVRSSWILLHPSTRLSNYPLLLNRLLLSFNKALPCTWRSYSTFLCIQSAPDSSFPFLLSPTANVNGSSACIRPTVRSLAIVFFRKSC